MFFSSNDDIIEMLTAGDHDDFGSEKLKSLMKLLPETEEVNLREKERLKHRDIDDFGSEKVKSLMKMLPETEEVSLKDKER